MPIDVEGTVNALAWMLFGAALLGMLAWRIRVPYAVVLVLGGVLAAATRLIALPQLEPRVLLFVFLPPLLFDAAFRLDDRELRVVARPVLLLALPGTVATAAVVGVVLMLALQLPLAIALLFGSIVAATDPIAVVAVFRNMRAPLRLSVIAEGESLINDGVAITLYTAFVGLATAGDADLLNASLLFLRQVIGGVAIGAVLGIVFSRLTGAIDDHMIEMMLSTALAYGSFLAAQSLDTSGALACVAAGLIHGSYGRAVGMTERSRRLLDDLWEYFGFLANALVFLLVGFSTNLFSMREALAPVAVSVLAVLGSRVLVVMGAPLLAWRRRPKPRDMPQGVLVPHGVVATGAAPVAFGTRARAVLVWGGLRGALTITLALALPAGLPNRDLLIAMAFGVVLFSLVIQGVTLPLAVRWAGLANPE